MTEETITNLCYTKEQVDAMVAEAVEEARRIDEASMAEHNLKATIISMILGFICLALFLDGTLRLLGIIPPFMDIDISIVDKIADKVETEVMPIVQDAAQKSSKIYTKKMNPITDIVFSITWILLLVWAVRSVISGWRSKAVQDFNAGRLQGEWTTEVVKPVHPEMKDVKPGTELLGVNFEKKTECDLEEYKALQARIEELKSELEDPWDDEDDDDGNVPTLLKK